MKERANHPQGGVLWKTGSLPNPSVTAQGAEAQPGPPGPGSRGCILGSAQSSIHIQVSRRRQSQEPGQGCCLSERGRQPATLCVSHQLSHLQLHASGGSAMFSFLPGVWIAECWGGHKAPLKAKGGG